jgi:adenosylmethionine-8-amino-7-oxononanoate aminotransferase
VTLAARERGAIIRPLGDVVVLMPPLAISKADLVRLVDIAREAIVAAYEATYGRAPTEIASGRPAETPESPAIREAA